MTFIDAWLVWLLSISQPTPPAPTSVGSVSAMYPTQQQTQSPNTWAAPAMAVDHSAVNEICGQGPLRAVSQISNGY